MSPTARSDPRDRLVHLDEPAVRELNAVAAILESLAVRRAPAFDAARHARLRAANARLRRAPDAVTAAIADCEVHALLVEPGADGDVLAMLRPVRGALRTCAAKRLGDSADRHAAEHDAVIDALADGDHALAAKRLREHVARGLPGLLEGVANRTDRAEHAA
jgi:DNA-binding GntR family transcriptional regulator